MGMVFRLKVTLLRVVGVVGGIDVLMLQRHLTLVAYIFQHRCTLLLTEIILCQVDVAYNLFFFLH